MNDFRLSVFLSVARNLNFTKAANELNISQPAISKHINEIESGYGVQLFERTKHKVSLTPNGQVFLRFAQEITNRYKDLDFEMNMLSQQHSGEIIIGASTTIAQYVLPKILSGFKKRFPEVRLSLVTGNTSQIETMIADRQIDLGLVEGASSKPDFHYTKLSDDKLVLVTASRNRIPYINLSELRSLPLILRESGSGTLEVIALELRKYGIEFSDLNILMQLGSSEAIKGYIIESDSYAIVSVAAISKELERGELHVIEISDLNFSREFSFISQLGLQNKLAERFMNFALMITNSYNL